MNVVCILSKDAQAQSLQLVTVVCASAWFFLVQVRVFYSGPGYFSYNQRFLYQFNTDRWYNLGVTICPTLRRIMMYVNCNLIYSEVIPREMMCEANTTQAEFCIGGRNSPRAGFQVSCGCLIVCITCSAKCLKFVEGRWLFHNCAATANLHNYRATFCHLFNCTIHAAYSLAESCLYTCMCSVSCRVPSKT